ncbi:MAG: hypothetical protein E7576_15645 [Ruminococcaceae bacterium]|nr:hypothetical protein [Oscillospiraceae bacterium]
MDILFSILREIIPALLLIGIFVLIAAIRRKKLKNNGLTRNQSGDFAYTRFIYTLRSVSCPDIVKALNRNDFASLNLPKLEFSCEVDKRSIKIFDNCGKLRWNARIRLERDDGKRCQYSFHFLEYPDAISQNMMIFHTIIEKTFLDFDMDTEIESELLKTRTKSSPSMGLKYSIERVEVIE